jgi:DNA/RNA endonuclease YhcR with UshA esterase domain
MEYMKEIFLVSLLLILSTAGLGIIYYAVSTIDPEYVKIGGIEGSMDGRLVIVDATVESVKSSSSGNIYVTISDDTGKITVPLLGKIADGFRELEKGASVRVTGTVSDYKYGLEIMPRSEKDILVGGGDD